MPLMTTKQRQSWTQQTRIGLFVLGIATLGVLGILTSHAATTMTSVQAEDGTVSANATTVSDTTAASGNSVKFGNGSCSLGNSQLCALTMVWNDEFNSTSVDTSKWTPRNNSNYGSGNNEDECYYAANAAVTGGNLVITGKRETVTCGGTNPDGGNSTYYFTSAFLVSTYNMHQGYVEASIKMPKGNLWWPAFWLTGGTGAPGWPAYGEFDVTEVIGGYPDNSFSTYHWKCGTANCQSSPNAYNLPTQTAGSSYGTALTSTNVSTFTGATSAGFVRYGLLWEANKITWYINGKPIRSLDSSGVQQTYALNGQAATEKTYTTAQQQGLVDGFGYNHVIDLNLAVGGNFPFNYGGYTGNETTTGYNNGNLLGTLPDTMQVNYVRVYQ